MPARQLRIQLATIGLQGMARLAWQNRTGSQLRAYEICRPLLEGRRGLELGGPSAIFSRTGPLPLYPLFDRLDNCDFASDTVWHGEAADGTEFTYDEERRPGQRLIRDATSLDGIEDASYDVVLASHTLEHIANPLLALSEWRRVVGADGHLVLVLPHLENTFDHRRPVTTLEHIESDFAASTPEDDPTHVREFIELCDLDASPTSCLARPSSNALSTTRRIERCTTTCSTPTWPCDCWTARAVSSSGSRLRCRFTSSSSVETNGPEPDNRDFLAPTAGWRRQSVFRRDRR